MKPPMPLRRRFALVATALGFLLSLLAAGTVALLVEDYEYIIATEVLRGQAEDYGLRLANGLPAQLPRTQRLSGYPVDSPDLPRAYAAFPPGVHEDPANEDTHVGVFDTAAGRLVFTVDLSDIEVLERHLHAFIAVTILFGTLLAGWWGWLFSGIALRPVKALAEGVEALPAEPCKTHLADGTSDDELGRLATAIDAYQARLLDADAREQAFLADASHELRTPLAVVQGVTEVLLDDPPERQADLARLQRLDRGVRDMGHLLEAMLGAARRKPLQVESIDPAAVLQEAAAMALAGKPGMRATIQANGNLRAPPREALLLVAGVARKLVQGHADGDLHIRLDADRVSLHVRNPAHADDEGSTRPAKSDIGTGSAMLDRLAVRLGWRVVFGSASSASIHFDA